MLLISRYFKYNNVIQLFKLFIYFDTLYCGLGHFGQFSVKTVRRKVNFGVIL